MSIKKLTINGLRGFSDETNIHFAIPDNVTPGRGLTILKSRKLLLLTVITLQKCKNNI